MEIIIIVTALIITIAFVRSKAAKSISTNSAAYIDVSMKGLVESAEQSQVLDHIDFQDRLSEFGIKDDKTAIEMVQSNRKVIAALRS